MASHTIEITVSEDGTMKAEIKGIKGKACEQVANWIKRLGKVVSHRPTKEAHEHTNEKVSIKN